MQEKVSKLRLDKVEGRFMRSVPRTNTDHYTEVHSAAERGDRTCSRADSLHGKASTTLADRANSPSS